MTCTTSAAPDDAMPDTCLPGEAMIAGACEPAIASDPSLVAYWPLDESVGATAFRDVSPNDNGGTCQPCPTAGVAGIRGSAVEFADASDGIDVGSGPSLTGLSGALTVLGWVRLASYDQYGYILSNDRDCGMCGTYSGFALWASHYATTPAFDAWDGTTDLPQTINAPTTLSLGQWHFLTATFDGDTSRLYVDAQLAKSATGVKIAAPPSFAMRLGAMGANPQLGTTATVDEVMVFSRALAPGEIADLFEYYTSL